MATDTAKVLETLGKMTVLELVELKNAIEEEWGVTAAAPMAAAAPAAAGGGGDGARGRGEVLVRRRRHLGRRQEDPGDQGRPRDHRPRPQGGEGPGRRRPQHRQGRREPGGGRLDQGAAGRGRRRRRAEVRRSPKSDVAIARPGFARPRALRSGRQKEGAHGGTMGSPVQGQDAAGRGRSRRRAEVTNLGCNPYP